MAPALDRVDTIVDAPRLKDRMGGSVVTEGTAATYIQSNWRGRFSRRNTKRLKAARKSRAGPDPQVKFSMDSPSSPGTNWYAQMSKGGLRFPGSRAKTALWAKLHNSTPADKAYELIDCFSLDPPSAIYSVIGHYTPDRAEAESANANVDAVAPFLRGLRTAAEKAGAWVTTRGLRSPTVALVGNAMLGSKQPCIGIAPWRSVFDRLEIERQRDDSVYTYPVGQVSYFKHRKQPHSSTSDVFRDDRDEDDELLEACHSHFIFIDCDAEHDGVDVGRDMRNAIQQHISNADLSGDGIETPCVAVVIGGDVKDLRTVEEVKYALECHNPVVVLAGSGGTADDICRCSRGGLEYFRKQCNVVKELSPGDYKDPMVRTEAYCQILEKIQELGQETGWNQTPQLSVFNYGAVDEEEISFAELPTPQALEHTLLSAATNDCKGRLAELLFAVRIGLPDILEHVIENGPSDAEKMTKRRRRQQERVEKALALETSLVNGNVSLVESLLAFNAEASLTFPEMLFSSKHNVYNVLPNNKATGRGLWCEPSVNTTYAVLDSSGLREEEETEQKADDHSRSRLDLRPKLSSSGSRIARLFKLRSHAVVPHGEGDAQESAANFRSGAGSAGDKREGDEQDPLSMDRATYLRKLDRIRSFEVPQDVNWISILEKLVDGYDTHINVRCANDPKRRYTLAPTWVDLMFWSTLAGKHQMTRVLWQKSRFPMRTALMVATLCARLAHDNKSEHQQKELQEQYDRYEQWVLDILDCCDSKDEAMGMLSIVPLFIDDLQDPHPVYKDSVIDIAAAEETSVTYACKRVVAHRHTQELLNNIWSGNEPGSKAALPPDTGWVMLILQMLFFFLPGVFVTVTETSNDTIYRPPEKAERKPQHRRNSFWGKAAPSPAPVEVEGARSRVEDPSTEKTTGPLQRVATAMRFGMQAATGSGTGFHRAWDEDVTPFPPALENVHNMWRKQEAMWSLKKVINFMGIPRVRFVIIMSLKILYMVWPTFFLVVNDYPSSTVDGGQGDTLSTRLGDDFGGGFNGMPAEIGLFELLFWIWTLAYILYEAGTFDASDGIVNGIVGYFSVPYNKMDFTQIIIQIIIIILRSSCANIFNSTESNRCAERPWEYEEYCKSCYEMQMVARTLYSLVTVLIWLRMFDLVRAFKSVGQMSIIFWRMMYKDVSVFMILVLIVSPGFGIAFAAMQPQRIPFPFRFGTLIYEVGSVLLMPFWGVLGDHNLEEVLEATVDADYAHFVAPVMLYAYLLVTTVVLVNLLIAQMSETYNSFLETANEEWAYQRAGLIRELKDDYDFTWPPPFNYISLFLKLSQRALNKLRDLYGLNKGVIDAPKLDKKGFKLYATDQYQDTLQRRERAVLELCLARQDENDEGKSENLLQSLHVQMKTISTNLSERIDARIERLETQIDSRFAALTKIRRGGSGHFGPGT